MHQLKCTTCIVIAVVISLCDCVVELPSTDPHNKHFVWNMNQLDREFNRSNEDIFLAKAALLPSFVMSMKLMFLFFSGKQNVQFDRWQHTHTRTQSTIRFLQPISFKVFSFTRLFCFFFSTSIDVIDVKDVCSRVHKKNYFKSTSDGVCVCLACNMSNKIVKFLSLSLRFVEFAVTNKCNMMRWRWQKRKPNNRVVVMGAIKFFFLFVCCWCRCCCCYSNIE